MNIHDSFQELRSKAAILAGEPSDIPQRAALLHEIFLDSKGNHGFAEIAAHGALWGFRFFETTGTLGNLISYRYFFQLKGNEISSRAFAGIFRRLQNGESFGFY